MVSIRRNRFCITGIGVVNSAGIGKENFWSNVSGGVNTIAPITKFDPKGYPAKVAGQLRDFVATKYIPRRLAVKMDTFSHYACAAANMALQDSKVDLSTQDPFNVGVWLGNNSGGWDICEQGLFELYRDGPEFVNPWQATAWFLSSAQGYVSISNGLKGISKTFCSDRTSGSAAIHFALNSLKLGRCKIALVGGAEAPITQFGLTCYLGTGDLAYAENDVTAYKPFDTESHGLILGEGAGVVIIESLEHALERGANIYGEITGSCMTNDHDGFSHTNLVLAMQNSLDQANITHSDIDFILPEGAATTYSDKAEASAIKECFFYHESVPITCPKSGFGHLYGASSITDLICGLMAAKNRTIPPTPNINDPDYNLNIVRDTKINKEINNFMLISRAREGGNVVLTVNTNVNLRENDDD